MLGLKAFATTTVCFLCCENCVVLEETGATAFRCTDTWLSQSKSFIFMEKNALFLAFEMLKIHWNKMFVELVWELFLGSMQTGSHAHWLHAFLICTHNPLCPAFDPSPPSLAEEGRRCPLLAFRLSTSLLSAFFAAFSRLSYLSSSVAIDMVGFSGCAPEPHCWWSRAFSRKCSSQMRLIISVTLLSMSIIYL